ncbi:MAG: hypothetical protein JSW03_08035 [Candidatus Eiseniibacteriota bacterium]|nr:MAG: hypothetical protein JSW03_08035 [Candidatus Eisenbacteria bacterium]
MRGRTRHEKKGGLTVNSYSVCEKNSMSRDILPGSVGSSRGRVRGRVRSSVSRMFPVFAAAFLLVLGIAADSEQVLARQRSGARNPRPQRPGAAVVSRASLAQPRPQRGERALRAIEEVRMRRLVRELKADERQSMFIRETYKKGLTRKHALLRERVESLREMRGLILAGDAVDAREREHAMDRLSRRFMEIERDIAESRWAMENQILEQLSPPQRVRYLLFNERFEREVRERIERLREARPAQPRVPAPPEALPPREEPPPPAEAPASREEPPPPPAEDPE